MSNTETGQLCTCCATWISNADDSACRDYYNHDHPQPSTNLGVVDLDDGPEAIWSHWTCDGCETEQKPGAEAWDYERI